MSRPTPSGARVTRPIFAVVAVLAVALLVPALHPWAWVFATLLVLTSATALVLFARDRRPTRR